MQKELRNKLRKAGYRGKTDLETILDALPCGIDKNDDRFTLTIEQNSFIYYSNSEGEEIINFIRKVNESLADCAARLWLKLKEEDLV